MQCVEINIECIYGLLEFMKECVEYIHNSQVALVSLNNFRFSHYHPPTTKTKRYLPSLFLMQ